MMRNSSKAHLIGKELRLVDTDVNDKPTGFVFTFHRDGDALSVGQSGTGKDGRSEPTSAPTAMPMAHFS